MKLESGTVREGWSAGCQLFSGVLMSFKAV